MNQRMKELASECWDQRLDGMHFDQEKFAQLIIKECGKVITHGSYRIPMFGEKYQISPPEIVQMIKEHFGVE